MCFLVAWVRHCYPNNRLHMALHMMQIEDLILKFDVSWKITFLTGRIGCGKHTKHENRLIYYAICDSSTVVYNSLQNESSMSCSHHNHNHSIIISVFIQSTARGCVNFFTHR